MKLATLLSALVLSAAPAFAQTAPPAAPATPPPAAPSGAPAEPTKLAIVNPAKIFGDMQETKDLAQRMDNERRALEDQARGKQARLQELQAQRNLLNPTSPQHLEKTRELTSAAVEFDTWNKITKLELERNQRAQMRTLFDKIQAATAQIAQGRGFDLVLAENRPLIPDDLEGVSVDELRNRIVSRNVLYATPRVDITADVTALLDRQYADSKK